MERQKAKNRSLTQAKQPWQPGKEIAPGKRKQAKDKPKGVSRGRPLEQKENPSNRKKDLTKLI